MKKKNSPQTRTLLNSALWESLDRQVDIFSCKDAALQVLMSICPSIHLSSRHQLHNRQEDIKLKTLFKAPKLGLDTILDTRCYRRLNKQILSFLEFLKEPKIGVNVLWGFYGQVDCSLNI